MKGGVYVVGFVIGTRLFGPVPGITRGDIGMDASANVLVRLLVGNLLLAVVLAITGYFSAYRAGRAARQYGCRATTKRHPEVSYGLSGNWYWSCLELRPSSLHPCYTLLLPSLIRRFLDNDTCLTSVHAIRVHRPTVDKAWTDPGSAAAQPKVPALLLLAGIMLTAAGLVLTVGPLALDLGNTDSPLGDEPVGDVDAGDGVGETDESTVNSDEVIDGEDADETETTGAGTISTLLLGDNESRQLCRATLVLTERDNTDLMSFFSLN